MAGKTTHTQREKQAVALRRTEEASFKPHRRIAAAAGFRAVQSTPLKSRGGSVLGMLSTHFRQPHRPSERDQRLLDLHARHAADLVERLRGEEQLRAAREQLRLVVDAMSAPVTRCSRDLRYLWVNKPSTASSRARAASSSSGCR